MKKLVMGLCVGGLLATAGGAIALRDSGPRVANIASVTPITAGMEQQYAEVLRVSEHLDPNAPRFAQIVDTRAIMVAGREEEICENVVVTHQAPVKDERQIVGTAAGAVLGGVLGNQVGGGNGKKVATAAGAIVGGIIGKNVQAKQQSNQTYQTTERQCRIERGADQVSGYDVTYQVDGASNVVRLEYKPSGQLPIVNGQLVTDKNEVNRLNKAKSPQQFNIIYQVAGQQGSVMMPSPPSVGDLLLAENGTVVTDPVRLAEIQAQQHQVIAYRVSYQLGDELGEARMLQKPMGTTLQIKNGQVVMADAGTAVQ